MVKVNYDKKMRELKKKGFEILTPYDKKRVINRDDKDFTSLSDLVLVHRTNYIPENKTIKTTYNAGAILTQKNFMIDGEKIDVDLMSGRNTTHFALNGEVSDHFYGNWSGKLYTIITPFKKKLKNKVRNVRIEDTYVEGNFYLSHESYILCPIDKVEEVYEKLRDPSFPRSHIIGCEKDLSVVLSQYGEDASDTFGYAPYVISNIMKKRPINIGEKGISLWFMATNFKFNKVQNNGHTDWILSPFGYYGVSKFKELKKSEQREIIASKQIEDILVNEGFSKEQQAQHAGTKEEMLERAFLEASTWNKIIFHIKSKIDVDDISLEQLLEWYKKVKDNLPNFSQDSKFSNILEEIIMGMKIDGRKNPYTISSYKKIDKNNYKKFGIDCDDKQIFFLNCFGKNIMKDNIKSRKKAMLRKLSDYIFNRSSNSDFFERCFHGENENDSKMYEVDENILNNNILMTGEESYNISLGSAIMYVSHDVKLRNELYSDLEEMEKETIDMYLKLFEEKVLDYLSSKKNNEKLNIGKTI